eukprot:COSAG06_NODE_410_length_16089_cov_9.968793_2_plen_97_part_00
MLGGICIGMTGDVERTRQWRYLISPPIATSLLVFKLPLLHEPLLHLHPLLYPGRRGHLSPGSCASCCSPRPREVWFYVYVYVILTADYINTAVFCM